MAGKGPVSASSSKKSSMFARQAPAAPARSKAKTDDVAVQKILWSPGDGSPPRLVYVQPPLLPSTAIVDQGTLRHVPACELSHPPKTTKTQPLHPVQEPLAPPAKQARPPPPLEKPFPPTSPLTPPPAPDPCPLLERLLQDDDFWISLPPATHENRQKYLPETIPGWARQAREIALAEGTKLSQRIAADDLLSREDMSLPYRLSSAAKIVTYLPHAAILKTLGANAGQLSHDLELH
jgi:hypothetical protein